MLGHIVDMGKGMGPEGMWDRFVLCIARASGPVVEGAVSRARAHAFSAPLVTSLGIIRTPIWAVFVSYLQLEAS